MKNVSPQDAHVLTHKTCMALCGKMGVITDVITLSILKWQDWPGFSSGSYVQSHVSV